MPAEADFERFRVDSGPPFVHFSALFGGSEFRLIFDRILGSNSEGPAEGGGAAEAHSESADTEETEGHRPPLHHALHPEGVRRI